MLTISPRSSVKVQKDGSCGSGTVFFNDGFALVFSNAHVTTERIGAKCTITSYFDGAKFGTRYTGRVVEAGFRRRGSLDFSIVKIDTEIVGAVATPLCKDGRCSLRPHFTGGSPGCESTSYRVVHWLKNISDRVLASLPNARPGMSGSGIMSKNAVASLITWTDGRQCLSQDLSKIYAYLQGEVTTVDSIPDNWQPACENPHDCDDRLEVAGFEFPAGAWTSCVTQAEPNDELAKVRARLLDAWKRRDFLAILALLFQYGPQIWALIQEILEALQDAENS